MIAVISAMDKELLFYLNALENHEKLIIMDYPFYKGTINGKEVVLVKSGIGKMAAAVVTTLLIEHFQPQLIINSGIAGGYNKKLNPLDIVIGSNIGCFDIDMRLDGTVYGAFRNDERFLTNNNTIENSLGYNVKYGTIMSSDTFAGDRTKLDNIFNEFYANEEIDAVDMESYAIALVCKKYNIAWQIIRSISDVVGMDSQIDSYETFASDAALKAYNLIIENYIK